MNVIDIIIIIIFAFAIYSGMKDGIIIQTCSLLGIAAGLYLASIYSADVASFCGISGRYSSTWGFVIVVIATMVVVSIAAQLLRKLLHFAGFGLLDVIMGITLSICKYALILSMLFSAFDMLNNAYKIIDREDLEQSKFYRPIANMSKYITPAWDWAEEQINTTNQKIQEIEI